MVKGVLLGGAAAVGLAAYAVRGKSSSLIAPSIWHGDRRRAEVALTFDDGPSESTPELLRVLDDYGVKATFFMCGQNVRRLKGIAREVVAAGHEVGNHTDSHSPLYFKSGEFIYRELSRAQEAIEEVTGVRCRLFRAPYGVRWPGLRGAQNRLGLDGVMWSTIGRDWKLGASEISERLLRNATNGAIFCLHDGRELRTDPDISATIGAVRIAIPVLKERFAFRRCGEWTGSPG